MKTNRIQEKLLDLFDGLLCHDGYGDLKVEVRILKRGQKEVILHCGKQYRYVIDFDQKPNRESLCAGSPER